jgi:hypothetical protein
LALIPAVIGEVMKGHVSDSWNVGFLIVLFYIETVTTLAAMLATDVLHSCEKAGGGEKVGGCRVTRFSIVGSVRIGRHCKK